MIFTTVEQAVVREQLIQQAKDWYAEGDAWTREEQVANVTASLLFLREFEADGVLRCLLHRAYELNEKDPTLAKCLRRFVSEVLEVTLTRERRVAFWHEWDETEDTMNAVRTMRVKSGQDPTVAEEEQNELDF